VGNLLEVRDLTVGYRGVLLVRGVSFDIAAGEIVCLVGESGSGKTLTGRAIMGLTRHAASRGQSRRQLTVGGSAYFGGRDLIQLPERDLRRVRGGQLGMIFQDPVAALDPVIRAGDQIAEAVRQHSTKGKNPKETKTRARVIELLTQVGITDPELRARQFPHELSGGMCQRVLIAIALAGDPSLLIADEPTTALDVTIQAQVLDLLAGLRRDRGMSVLLITHDLGVAAQLADRILVMYAGALAELAPAADFFAGPGHPYSRGLIQAVPRIDATQARRLPAISGSVPEPASHPPGCSFSPRCPRRIAVCEITEPELTPEGRSLVACHLAGAGQL
jgi:oligopeptide/dipeptide ABC transporter ATP-binding protein